MLSLDMLDLPPQAHAVARAVNEYDPAVRLIKLPPQHPWLIDHPEKPYALVHGDINGHGYILESFPESMLDDRLIRILWETDARTHGWDFSKFDMGTAAAFALNAQIEQDRLDEANSKMAWTMKKRRD